jgi:uncharacterized protein YjdB
VTGVAAGTVTITATSEGKSGTSTVTVTVAPVGSVTVTPSPTTIIIGQSTVLTATVKDVNGNTVSRAVLWSSSKPAKATVTSSGVVTAVDTGAVTITATSEGVSGTASVTIVPVPVASVTVTPPSATIGVGKTVALAAVTKDANGNILTGRTITWSTSDATVATVSSTGVVTGQGSGGKSATITATSEGKSGTATITVTLVPVGSVTVTPSPDSVAIGQTVQLTATVKDTNGLIVTDRPVTWTSSNTAVATVSPTGLVKGVALGTVTISAKAETKTGQASVKVTPVPVASVTVQPSDDTILQNQSTTFTAVTKDANGNVLTGRLITWTSSNTSVATVSTSGTTTGGVVGVTTITATSEGKNGTATLHVNPAPVASVVVSPATASINKGQMVQLRATAMDASNHALSGRTFTWTSGNSTIATVDSSGIVTGVKTGGPVTITATETISGKQGTSAITVK